MYIYIYTCNNAITYVQWVYIFENLFYFIENKFDRYAKNKYSGDNDILLPYFYILVQ